jgi:DNA-binding transcriptional MerR regulator
MSGYTISQVEQISGIRAFTLRTWESRYQLLSPQRTAQGTGIRLYTDHELRHILNIGFLRERGYRVSQISRMSAEELYEAIWNHQHQYLPFADRIAALQVAMLSMDEDQFEKIFNTCIIQVGFETTMVDVIFPFLARVGTCWMTDRATPVQEHFVTNLIRRKLIVAIEGQRRRPFRAAAQTFLLFLPEGELHEIGLLLAHYLLRSRGQRVIYVGRDMPLRELPRFHEQHPFDHTICIITSTPGPTDVQAYVTELGVQLPHVRHWLTGFQVVSKALQISAETRVLESVHELVSRVDAL